jgi:hypothetical protein
MCQLTAENEMKKLLAGCGRIGHRDFLDHGSTRIFPMP